MFPLVFGNTMLLQRDKQHNFHVDDQAAQCLQNPMQYLLVGVAPMMTKLGGGEGVN